MGRDLFWLGGAIIATALAIIGFLEFVYLNVIRSGSYGSILVDDEALVIGLTAAIIGGLAWFKSLRTRSK